MTAESTTLPSDFTNIFFSSSSAGNGDLVMTDASLDGFRRLSVQEAPVTAAHSTPIPHMIGTTRMSVPPASQIWTSASFIPLPPLENWATTERDDMFDDESSSRLSAFAEDDNESLATSPGKRVKSEPSEWPQAAWSVASDLSGASTATTDSVSSFQPEQIFSARGGACRCRVCGEPTRQMLDSKRHCTKGHRFEWLELCPNHPLRSQCTHVNKCSSCHVNRGFSSLQLLTVRDQNIPTEPMAVEEFTTDGRGTNAWVSRGTDVRIESKRSGNNGTKRPYQSNTFRVSGFQRAPQLQQRPIKADIVVLIDSQFYRVVSVWSNGKHQIPLELVESTPDVAEFRLTLNPAEYRSLQPIPMNPAAVRPKGIGWATIVFFTPEDDGTSHAHWLWADIPVVSDKFDKIEVKKKLPSGFNSISEISSRAKHLAKSARGDSDYSVRRR